MEIVSDCLMQMTKCVRYQNRIEYREKSKYREESIEENTEYVLVCQRILFYVWVNSPMQEAQMALTQPYL